MPQMFKARGVRAFFRDPEVGLKAGYFRTFNDMCADQRAKVAGNARPAPVAKQEAEAPPAPPKVEGFEDRPAPPAVEEPSAVARRPCPDMELGEVKAHAERLGLDTSIHHMQLRKQVEEKLNAEIGSD